MAGRTGEIECRSGGRVKGAGGGTTCGGTGRAAACNREC